MPRHPALQPRAAVWPTTFHRFARDLNLPLAILYKRYWQPYKAMPA